MLENLLRFFFSRSVSRLLFESNIEVHVLRDAEMHDRLYFEIDAVKSALVDSDAVMNSFVSGESLRECLCFAPMNLILHLTQLQSQFAEVCIEHEIVLDPRRGNSFADLAQVHRYNLSAFIYRENAGRLVTLFSCEGMWLQFDGGEIMRCSQEDVNEVTRRGRKPALSSLGNASMRNRSGNGAGGVNGKTPFLLLYQLVSRKPLKKM